MAERDQVNPDFPDVLSGASVAIYQRRLVAFVDVLGWSDLVDKSVNEPARLETLSIAKNRLSFPALAAEHRRKFFNEHLGPERLGTIPPGVDATQFSDTVVFSCPTGSWAASDLISQVQLTCMTLLLDGHYTRGAIVVGQLHHDEHSIFGPALIEAYRLEQNVAKYPRIVVSPQAVPLLARASRAYTLRPDVDGLAYIDILGFVAEGPDGRRRKQGFEDRLLAAAKERLKSDECDLGRTAKHTWMIRYLEAILNETTEQRP